MHCDRLQICKAAHHLQCFRRHCGEAQSSRSWHSHSRGICPTKSTRGIPYKQLGWCLFAFKWELAFFLPSLWLCNCAQQNRIFRRGHLSLSPTSFRIKAVIDCLNCLKPCSFITSFATHFSRTQWVRKGAKRMGRCIQRERKVITQNVMLQLEIKEKPYENVHCVRRAISVLEQQRKIWNACYCTACGMQLGTSCDFCA